MIHGDIVKRRSGLARLASFDYQFGMGRNWKPAVDSGKLLIGFEK